MRRLVKIVLGLIMFFVTSQMVVLTGAKGLDGQQDDDLFAPYVEIMPGKLASSLIGRCISYDQVDPETTTRMNCRLKTTEGYYTSGYVYVYNDTIESIAFDVNGLRVGDLAKRWGRPWVENTGAYGYGLHWNIGAYQVVVPQRNTRQYSYWSPITYLVVTSSEESSKL